MLHMKNPRAANPPRHRPPMPESHRAPQEANRPAFVEDIQDLLGGLTDRGDLERLFDRRIALPQIVRLMGHQVSREQILDLLSSPEIEKDLKKLLS